MDNIYIIAIIISLLFMSYKYIDYRQSTDENKSLKPIVKDGIILFICLIAGNFIYKNVFSGINPQYGGKPTLVFTDNPEF